MGKLLLMKVRLTKNKLLHLKNENFGIIFPYIHFSKISCILSMVSISEINFSLPKRILFVKKKVNSTLIDNLF